MMDDNEALELLEEIKPKLDVLKRHALTKGRNNKTRKTINRVIQNEIPELGEITMPEKKTVIDEKESSGELPPLPSEENNKNELQFQLPNSKVKIVNVEKIKRRWAKKFMNQRS